MPDITLRTSITAPRQRVFDLARSIDAHQASTDGTSERAVAGVTSGLIRCGERVTWEARHFAVRQRLTVEIVDMVEPVSFRDIMIDGTFASMSHDHVFEEEANGTLMVDRFSFRAPLGVFGRIAEIVFLTSYMRRFLRKRALALKAMAESEQWKTYLTTTTSPCATDNARYRPEIQ